MQEAALVLGMVLHRFKLIDHQRYRLKIKETATMKPEGLRIRVRPRAPHERLAAAAGAVSSATMASTAHENDGEAQRATTAIAHHNTPLLVLYGSNLGSAEELAHRIGQDGEANGFAATIAPLDDYVGKLPDKGAVIVVSASYNGTPPDNPVKFCAWLADPETPGDAVNGVSYAVFGCGNRDWAATFQALPRLIDERLAAHGGSRIYPRGEGHPAQDFIYADERRTFADAGVTELAVAYSRLEGRQRVCVQDKVLERKDEVRQFIEDSAVIYVCGDASRMAPDARRTFAEVYAEKGNATREEASAWIDRLTADGRYLVDVWTAA